MDPLIISIILMGTAVILLVIWVITLERRITKLLSGKSGASLEEIIARHAGSLEELFHSRTEIQGELAKLDARIKRKMETARTKRFNPFAGTGTGGNQSFATALLDEKGDGVVLSTLYSREKVSIFAKPVKDRTSEFELTEEEQEVLR